MFRAFSVGCLPEGFVPARQRGEARVGPAWARKFRLRQRRLGQAAFSVIELLVAMVILMIIVTVFARFFQRSSQSWESGMRTVETAIAGRAAVNLIVRDIERAVADPVLVDEVFADGQPAFFLNAAELRLISLSRRPPYRAQRIRYYIQDGALRRVIDTAYSPLDPSQSPPHDHLVVDHAVSVSFQQSVNPGDVLPNGVRVVLKLSNRYDPAPSRHQEFVGLAFPVHRHRYPVVD